MDFSNKLRELRLEKRLTALQVAELLGCTRAAYSHYERGIRQPDYEVLAKLAVLYDVTTDYLLGLEREDGTKIVISEAFNNACQNLLKDGKHKKK